MKNISDFLTFSLLEGRTQAISIDKLFASKKSMRVGIADMQSKQYSYTTGALSVWKTEEGELHVVDGYHRLWEALLIGKKWLMVTTIGNGYSPEWNLANNADKFKCDSSLRFGGLESIISDVSKLERMYDTYLKDKGEDVLDFPLELPKRKPSVRKVVDKLVNVRNSLYNLKSIRMSEDMVSFKELLKFLTKSIEKLDKKTIQQAIDDIITNDSKQSFFVKLDEMEEWGFLFKKYTNKVIYDKALKANQFMICNYNDSWLPRLVNSEAR